MHNTTPSKLTQYCETEGGKSSFPDLLEADRSLQWLEKMSPPVYHTGIICMSVAFRKSLYYLTTGTRYKRRGVDADGNVANYVETEILVQCGIHVVSYVVIRGSVPVYWTQPGYKYRPVPIIEKSTVCVCVCVCVCV